MFTNICRILVWISHLYMVWWIAFGWKSVARMWRPCMLKRARNVLRIVKVFIAKFNEVKSISLSMKHSIKVKQSCKWLLFILHDGNSSFQTVHCTIMISYYLLLHLTFINMFVLFTWYQHNKRSQYFLYKTFNSMLFHRKYFFFSIELYGYATVGFVYP